MECSSSISRRWEKHTEKNLAECTKFFWRRGKEDGRCQKDKAEIQSFQVQWDWLRFLPATGRKEWRVFKRWIRERIQRIFFTARKRWNLKKSMWKTHSFPHSPQTFPQPVIHNSTSLWKKNRCWHKIFAIWYGILYFSWKWAICPCHPVCGKLPPWQEKWMLVSGRQGRIKSPADFQAKNADITGKMRIMILHATSVIIFWSASQNGRRNSQRRRKVFWHVRNNASGAHFSIEEKFSKKGWFYVNFPL